MRNYVIINGVNSLTIPGLAIKSLPPITKPIQRTLREEIDGRDGDIITELGYGAYDKEIEIGLFGNFDVDQIIAYFNQKGTITFSNEPDKVYYFQALNQVDYEELIKFREAGVELHCQPFKYPVTEEPLIEEYEYVTGSGETITLDNTEETTFNEIELQGNTEQFQTTGKNLLETMNTSTTKNGVTFTPNADGSITITGTATSGINQQIINANNPPIIEAGTYTRSVKTVGTITKNSTSVLLTGRNSAFDNIMGDLGINENATTTRTSTTTGTNTMSGIGIYISGAGAVFDCTLYIQLEKSATATDWEPYTGGNPAPNPDYPEDIHVVSGDNEIIISGEDPEDTDTYPINLPEGMEMAELPETDYHDTFIRGDDEKWYKEENIKKVIYNGSSGEAWTYYQGIVFIDDTDIKDLGLTNNTFLLSNYFTAGTGRFYIAHSTRQRIHINLNAVGLSDITNVTQWKEWLGTHNLEILFIRNENLIEITGDLADQLEALWRANSKKGQTNIMQTNNDMPFFMIVSALKLGSDVITIPDGGNIYSKPTIKLEGTGIVDIYLNDVQEFEVDLTEDNEITIDTEKMEAYTETGLANRKVTGDYSKFKLQPGDNELRFSGDLTKATITRYTRWL